MPKNTSQGPRVASGTVPADIMVPSQGRKTYTDERVPLVNWYGDREARLYNPDDLVGRKGLEIYERMGVDDQIAAALRVKRLSRLASGWDIHPAGEDRAQAEQRDFIADTLQKMPGGLDTKLEQMMLAMQYGFSISEKIFALATAGRWSGKYGYKDIKSKSPLLFNFVTDPYGNIMPDGIELTYGASSVAGTTLNAHGYGTRLPRDKMVLWSYNSKFSNPYGESDLRACYRSWFSKDLIMKLFNLHIEKFASPTAMAFVPESATDDERLSISRALETIQSMTAATFPEGVDVKFMESRLGGAIAFRFQDAIDMHNRLMARAILVPDMLGYSGGVAGGSFALGRKQIDIYFLVLSSLGRDLEDIIGEQVIKPIVDLNWANVEAYPRFRFREVEDDLAVKVKVIELLSNVGAIDPREDWVRSYLDLPTNSLPPPQADVFSALHTLSEKHGLVISSQICPVCLLTMGRDFVADRVHRVAYHSQCLDAAGGCVKDGHTEGMLRVQMMPGGESRVTPWHIAQPLRLPAAPVHAHAETHVHVESPRPATERATPFARIKAGQDKLVAAATLELAPVFTAMRDKLVEWAKRRRIVEKKDMETLDRLPINVGRLKEILHSLAMTAAGNGAVEAGLEVAKKLARYADTHAAPAQLSDELLSPADARRFYAERRIASPIGVIKIDLGGFLSSYFMRHAFTLAGAEKDWLTTQARGMLETAIRQGDPRLAEERLVSLFDAYLGRGVAPARLTQLLRTLGSVAFNEGRRSVFQSDVVAPHIVAYQWSSVMDEATSPYCFKMDGKVFRPEQMATLFPPAHFNCRSTIIAIVNGEDFQLSPGDPLAPAAGVSRAVGFAEGGETLSSVLDLSRHDQMFSAMCDDATASIFPTMRRAEPPWHVTLLYAHDMPGAEVDALAVEIKPMLAARPLELKLHRLSIFQNEDGQAVVHLPVESPELVGLHSEMKLRAQAHGAVFTYPTYRPHVTLGYVDEGATDAQIRAVLDGMDGLTLDVEANLSDAGVTIKRDGRWLPMAEEGDGIQPA